MGFALGDVFQLTASSVFNFKQSAAVVSPAAQRRVEVVKPSVSLRGNGSVDASPVGSHAWNRGFSEGSSPSLVVRAGPESATPVKPSSSGSSNRKKYPGEAKGFVEEMRFVAMKLHTKEQSKEGEKVDEEVKPLAKWQPTVEGYLKFLVDSKKVYDTLEEIVATAAHPSYAEFRNTGLERSSRLATDLEWFKSQGYEIPEVGEEGTKYAELLKGLSETDPPAFICHFYNVYFAHSAGGKFIGQKVAEMLIDGKVLEFYKWDGDLPTILSNVKAKLNAVAENWTREEKNHCLEETGLSFKYSGKILRLIAS